MTKVRHHLIPLAIVLLVSLCGRAALAADFDFNRDGMIRVAFLSTPKQNGDIDAALICSDLETMIKASSPDVPVRVTLESVTLSRSLMGWWYHPDTQAARTQLFTGKYDLLLVAENDDIVRDYPEFCFEGVRAVNQEARSHGIRTALVQMSKPGNSFRDTRVQTIAEKVYRIGDGCGIEVIPAAYAWHEALTHNRITGNSPVRARACAYLTAASVYCQLADARVPKGALEAYWTTKKTTDVLARSARDAVRNERVNTHYHGPFSGVVRIEPQITKRLKVFAPNTSDEDPIRQNLQFILDAAFQDWFWKTPADWYRDGFDRYSSTFDLVYGDLQQMDLYLDPKLYTSMSPVPTNRPAATKAVFCRNPSGDTAGLDTLRNLEPILFEGYDYAKNKGLNFIPYQIAWARVRQADPKLVRKTETGRNNDWLSYMMANMIYTQVTGRYQPVLEKKKPHYANETHPRDAHDICARIGYDTLMQLSTLTESLNTVLLRTETYRISADNPGFVGIRLLDRPRQEVTVFCATDLPGVAVLSSESLAFTPNDFDIEQTVRILPATNTPTLFFHFMASAQSADKAIDGTHDLRPFILNFHENENGRLTFDREAVSPRTGFEVTLRPVLRPCDMVKAQIVQHGILTQEVYFDPEHAAGATVRIHPTADDYAKGVLQVSVQTTSADLRYHQKNFPFAFRVSSDGLTVPGVAVTLPQDGTVIAGPAFVTAKAETAAASGIRDLAVYLGCKKLGSAQAPSCSVAAENGPPQSRLGVGRYTLWAETATTDGVYAASAPVSFTVRDSAGPVGVSAAEKQ